MQQPADREEEGFTLPAPDLRKLTAIFSSGSMPRGNRRSLLHQFLQQSVALINGAGIIYFSRQQEELTAEDALLSRQALAMKPAPQQQMAACSLDAINQDQTCYRKIGDGPLFCVSCPLPRDRGCIAALLVTDGDALSPFLVILQLLAALLDQHLFEKKPAGDSAEGSSALVPFIDNLAMIFSQPPGEERIPQLNQAMKSLAGADLAALALVGNGPGNRLVAISDVAAIDPRTRQVRLLQKGIHECIIRKTPLCWPRLNDPSIHLSLILEEIARSTDGAQVAVLPLAAADSQPQAVLLLVWRTNTDRTKNLQTILGYAPFLTGLLSGFEHQANRKWKRHSTHGPRGWPLRKKVTAGVAVLLLLLLFLPVPYRLSADAVVRPQVTRFVVSRYDGILARALVRPGDHVKKTQELARLDGRETEVDLAALQAELDKAKKIRDQATALGNTAAAQVAYLDTLRYRQQVLRLQEQLNHLTLTSPVNGIVLSGDLQRAEGSPVSRGQTLFEVAPLESMEVEVAVDEQDISRVSEETEVSVHFDAYPDTTWHERFTRIEPRAQIRENKNIFVGILRFANPANRLRPGMRGKAKIEVGTRTLGWIILHKPWYTFLRLLDSLF